MSTIRIFRHHLQLRLISLAVTQTLLLIFAVYISVNLRFATTHTLPIYGRHVFWKAVVLSIAIIFSLQTMGLYQKHLRARRTQLIVRILISLAFAGVLISVIYYIFPPLFLGRGIIALTFIEAFFFIWISHRLFFSHYNTASNRRRILIYGAGQNTANILDRMRRKTDWLSFELLGCVSIPGEKSAMTNFQVIKSNKNIFQLAMEKKAEEVVICMDDKRDNFPTEALLKCRLNGIAVSDVLDFYERSAGKIKTDLLTPGWIIFSDGFRQSKKWRVLKRMMDLLGAVCLLTITWPVMLLAALAIWTEDGFKTPALYRQTRVGQFGRNFTIIKFRSMRVDAEKFGNAVWATEDDPRITRVGRYLRKYRIDELPQIFNVIKGEMSFVGPRPERPKFVEQLSKELQYYELRHRAKPGITGWAQLCYPYGSTKRDALEKLQFDLYYVKNSSLFLDLVITLGTIEVILFRKGSR